MFATSFRAKLIGWYVGMAAIVALAFIAIAAVVLAQVYASGQRQELEAAARQIHSVIAREDQSPQTIRALEVPLQRRFADAGVMVRVHAFPDQPPFFATRNARGDVYFRAGTGPPPPPPPGPILYGQKGMRISPVAGFLELKMRPEAIRTKNAEVFLFVNPAMVNLAISSFLLASACFFVLVLFIA